MAKSRKGPAAIAATALAAALAFLLANPGSAPQPPPVDYNPAVTAPSTRGFGEPCDTGDFVTVTIYGRDRLWNSGAQMPLAAALEVAQAISDYRPDISVGTYNCRMIRGSTSVWSHHAWATAVDFDPAQNCLGCPTAGTELGKEPEFVRAFEAFGFVWGGRWSRPDAMHFEYDGPAMRSRVEVYPGMKGAVVTFLREAMRENDLPTYRKGPYRLKEIVAIIAFQRANRLVLKADDPGYVGDATWTLLILGGER